METEDSNLVKVGQTIDYVETVSDNRDSRGKYSTQVVETSWRETVMLLNKYDLRLSRTITYETSPQQDIMIIKKQ